MSRIFVAPIIGQSAASGAQVIDGSLKFDGGQYLSRTPSSTGDRQTWTWSFWTKRTKFGGTEALFGAYTDSNNRFYPNFNTDNKIAAFGKTGGTTKINVLTDSVFRDIGWYHVLIVLDTTESAASDKLKYYINGNIQDTTVTTTPTDDIYFNLASVEHRIGDLDGTVEYDGFMSQCYFVDGQALGPENFGFTDGLTNTWKPKKYTGTFGTNGFWLPMDGNSPIGEDKSGNGNNWTPVNFGGSLELDNPNVSGARPILNTTQGGSQAGIGVFGSKENKVYTVTYADDGGGNKYYIDGVKQATLTGLIRGATYTFDTVALGSTHPFRLSATSAHGTEFTNGVKAVTGAATTITIPHNAPDTLYYYCTAHSGMGSSITGITTNAKLADQFASNCILALPLVGVATDVSASIACTSIQKGQSNYGDPGASRAKSVFYDESYYFDGNDALELGTINGTDLEMGTSDFCIEGWFNGQTTLDATYWNPILTLPWHGQDNAESQFFIGFAGGDSSPYSAGEFHARIKDSSSIKELPSGLTTLYNDQTWHHFALTKNGTTAALFVDGVLKKTETTEASLNTGLDDQRGYIASYNNNTGSPGSPQGFYKGYISDLRIYKGVAKYVGVTTDVQYFVPPSTSPDILPDTPSGVSGGSKLAKIAEGAVSFDGSNGRLNLYPNADFAFGTGDFTVECYVYSNNRGTYDYIIDGRNSSQTSGTWSLAYGYAGSNGRLEFASGGSTLLECPAHLNPETNKWTHIAVTRSGTSLRMFIDGVLATSATDSTNFSTSPTNSSVGTRYSNQHYWDGAISNIRVVKGTALYTSNFVPSLEPLTKISQGATESEVKLLCCKSNTVAGTAVTAPGMGGVNDGTVWSTSVSGGIGPYANGFDGSTSTYMYPRNQDAEGNLVFAGGLPCDGVYCNTYSSSGTEFFTDSASSPTSVDTSSSFAWVDLPADATVLNQIKGTGGAGYNAFAIAAFRKDGTTLMDPLSPNGGVAASNFTPFNTIDTVRGQETGYATFNPIEDSSAGGGAALSDGNLQIDGTSSEQFRAATIPVSSGKWYFEIIQTAGTDFGPGVWAYPLTSPSSNFYQNENYRYNSNGGLYDESSKITDYSSFAVGDIIGTALDMDNGKVYFSKNGIFQNSADPVAGTGAAASDLTGTWIFGASTNGNSTFLKGNFGQKPFKFPPPDGFQPLTTANTRPVKVISRPNQYVGVATYTGNDSAQSINLGFKPDFVWFKNRGSIEHPSINNSVRGANKQLESSRNVSETTHSNVLTSFDSFGFTVGSSSAVNEDTVGQVAWAWKAGGNKNTFNVDDVGYASAAAAGLTGGDITPTGASVGTKQGFSIIRFTGPGSAGFQSVPHGLSEKPKFILCKDLDNARNWSVFHEDVITTDSKVFYLNHALAIGNSDTNTWDISAINATTFTPYFRDDYGASINADNIAFLWHDVPGLQKFGTYTGNGASGYPAADGPFIELGFLPRIIIIKSSTTDEEWIIYDTERNKVNYVSSQIATSSSAVESTGDNRAIDVLSNGFKVRNNSGRANTNGATYIYAAWAEAPTVDLYGGGANAR